MSTFDPTQLNPFGQGISLIGKFVDLVQVTALSQTVILVGLIPFWLKFVAVGSLVFGVLFCVAGPAIALLHLDAIAIRKVSKAEAFDNLRSNKKVDWLIRVIPYNPNSQPDLSISKLKKLDQKN